MPDPVRPPDPFDLEEGLAASDVAGAAELAGPMRIVSSGDRPDGGRVYQVTAARLVAVDAADPALRDVSVGVPVTARVEVDAAGEVVALAIDEGEPSTEREARTFARNLLVNGAVKGIPASGGRTRRGPPVSSRTTHELAVDERGRKVIRRTGFTITPGGMSQRRGGG